MFQKLRLKLNKVQQKQKIKTEGSEHHVTLILRFTHGLLNVLYMVCMYIRYIIYKESCGLPDLYFVTMGKIQLLQRREENAYWKNSIIKT